LLGDPTSSRFIQLSKTALHPTRLHTNTEQFIQLYLVAVLQETHCLSAILLMNNISRVKYISDICILVYCTVARILSFSGLCERLSRHLVNTKTVCTSVGSTNVKLMC
jgi:hypothetical protein